MKRILIITLILNIACFMLLSPLYAQEAAKVYTLDETLTALSGNNKSFRWDPFFMEGSFSVQGHYGAFSTDLSSGKIGFLMIDNRDIYQVPLPYQQGGELVFPESFVTTAREAFAHSIEEDSSHYRIATIIIDPGHGGNDPGAASTQTINGKSVTVTEKDIVLKSSKMLRDMLARVYPDKRILMTRESDITCSLEERTLIANAVPVRKNEAIIYISIHANSSRDKNAKGFEVWHLNQDYRRNVLDDSEFPDAPELHKIMNLLTEEAYNTESIRIAESILNSLKMSMGKSMPSRGLKNMDWFVVRHSNMPAVLVELGFVSNKDDALLMSSDTGLHKLTEAVYKGIIEFVGNFERSGGIIAAR